MMARKNSYACILTASLVWISLLIMTAGSGCSSGEPAVDEQSKTQSDVLGEHFKGKRPENFQKK
jgi:hypothetical protein